jgi:hypothetical protein
VAWGAGAPQQGTLAADATHLYWSAADGLRRISLGGGSIESLSDRSGVSIHFDGGLLVTRSSDVEYHDKTGRLVRTGCSARDSFQSVDGTIFYADETDRAIWRLDEACTRSVRVADDASGPFTVQAGTLVYGSIGAIIESPLERGKRRRLVPAQGAVRAIHVDDEQIVFADDEGVKRAPRKGGAAELLSRGAFTAVARNPAGTVFAGGVDGVFVVDGRGTWQIDRGWARPRSIVATNEVVYYATYAVLRSVPLTARLRMRPPVDCRAVAAQVSSAALLAGRASVVVDDIPVVNDFAVSDAHAYVASASGVTQLSLSNGSRRQVYQGVAIGVATDGKRVYWLTPSVGGMGAGVGPGRLLSWSPTAPAGRHRSLGPVYSTGPVRLVALGAHLYGVARDPASVHSQRVDRWHRDQDATMAPLLPRAAKQAQVGFADDHVVAALADGTLVRIAIADETRTALASSDWVKGLWVAEGGTVIWTDDYASLWRKEPALPAYRWMYLGALRPTWLARSGDSLWIAIESSQSKHETHGLLRLDAGSRCPEVVGKLEEPLRDLAVVGSDVFLLRGDSLLRWPASSAAR